MATFAQSGLFFGMPRLHFLELAVSGKELLILPLKRLDCFVQAGDPFLAEVRLLLFLSQLSFELL